MTRKQIRSHVRSHLVRLLNNTNQLNDSSMWTDDEINALIDHASKMFLEETGLLETSETVTVTSGVGTITGNVIQVKRVEISNKPVGFIYKHAYDEDLPAVD